MMKNLMRRYALYTLQFSAKYSAVMQTHLLVTKLFCVTALALMGNFIDTSASAVVIETM